MLKQIEGDCAFLLNFRISILNVASFAVKVSVQGVHCEFGL